VINLNKKIKKKIDYDKLQNYCKENGVLAIYLFGSQLGEKTDKFSDLDLGVVFFESEKDKLNDVNFYMSFKNELVSIFDFSKIDLLFLQNSGLKIPFKVITNGEVIYSADREKRLDYEDMAICKGLDFKKELELYYKELEEKILSGR